MVPRMEQAFLDFVSEILGCRASMDTAYGAIPQWDSVMHIRLVMEIQERYGVEIPLEAIADIRKASDFLKFLPQNAG